MMRNLLVSLLLSILLLVHRGHGQQVTVANVLITWNNRGAQTDFVVTSSLGGGVTSANAWIGVGLMSSASNAMMGADVIMCLNSGGTMSVQHNYNNNYASALMDASAPQLGITNANVTVVGSSLRCSYTRDNSNPNANYFNLNTNQSPFITTAFGAMSGSSTVRHSSANRGYSSGSLSFAPATTTTAAQTPASTTRATTTVAAASTATTRNLTTMPTATTTTRPASSMMTSIVQVSSTTRAANASSPSQAPNGTTRASSTMMMSTPTMGTGNSTTTANTNQIVINMLNQVIQALLNRIFQLFGNRS